MDGGNATADPLLGLTAVECGKSRRWKALEATEGFPSDFPFDTRSENSYFSGASCLYAV